MRAGAIAALILALCVVASASATVSRRAALRIVSFSPVTLRGVHFRAHERVRVRISTSRSIVRRVVASPQGAFVVSGPAPYDPCTSSLTAVAIGSGGSRVTLKLAQRECPPA